MTVSQRYRGSTSCLDLVRGRVWVLKPPLEVLKKFRTTPTETWCLKSKAVYGLKCNILVRLVLKFLQTFKDSFRVQTMPITRSKQLWGLRSFLWAWSTLRRNRSFKYWNYNLGEIRMTVWLCYRASTSCLDLVRGIVWVPKPPLEVCKKIRTTPTERWHL